METVPEAGQGIVPVQVQEVLVGGNALVAGATFLAILLGTITGGLEVT